MQQETADIAEIKKGDPIAFQRMVHHTRDWGFNVAFRLLGQTEDARDVLQEAYLTCWEKRQQLRPDRQFAPWLYRIIVHKCYDALRSGKRKRKQKEEQEYLQDTQAVETSVTDMESRESMELLQQLVKTLGYKQRTVFVLSELEGKGREEIAAVLGISKSTVKSNLHHARKKLREKLEKINEIPQYGRTVRE